VERLDRSADQNIPRLQPHFQLSSTGAPLLVAGTDHPGTL